MLYNSSMSKKKTKKNIFVSLYYILVFLFPFIDLSIYVTDFLEITYANIYWYETVQYDSNLNH